jgi:type VI secretion system secreted protein VgrG
MSKFRPAFASIFALTAVPIALLGAASPGLAAPFLGAASDFAVLAGASVTNTGSTVVTGELGVSPLTSVTGFPPGLVDGGVIHLNDGPAIAAMGDFFSAYATVGGLPAVQNLTGGDLGVGTLGTLTPGVYRFDSTALLNGALTLDAGNDASAKFVFLIGSALTTASGSSVLLANGTFFDNVFWWTGTAATLGSTTAFAGTILAGSSITLDAGASIVCGRALAQASVTMITNRISIDCQAIAAAADDSDGHPAAVPESGALAVFGMGLLGLAGIARRRRRNARSSAAAIMPRNDANSGIGTRAARAHG